MDLLLDTDALLWMSQGSPRLGPRAASAFETAARDGSLRFSAVSMLEVARLHYSGRIELPSAPELWHRDLLAAGVREIPVTSETAMLAASLHANHGFHSDPADQLVTASAMVAKRPLVTSDRKILHWASARTAPQCLDACA
ncbi:MAG: type II toxin-antitoxin system VapC family toxin [Acidimicrobiaceae bacterium]|nr:type II toxin-antitoxin system VapC family toxin [Acidimicrobiaceae bacterium]